MSTPFGDFFRKQRQHCGLTMANLAAATDTKVGTLYTYESGRRTIPDEKASILRSVLCSTPSERETFDSLLSQATLNKPHLPFEVVFDSAVASIRVGVLTYPPFSGDQRCFIDKFLQALFDLSVIKLVPVLESGSDLDGPVHFDMRDRLRWIEEHRADVLINLVNAQRLKKLSFLLTPIRVSLNGVILKSDEASLEAAQRLLTQGHPDPDKKYRVLAIESEVGHAYVTRTIRPTDEQLMLANTLDPKALAERLRFPPGRQVMLVCDEITALSVVAALDGVGTLVLPPSSDASVTHFAGRRSLPIHFLGLGLKRQANNQLLTYLTESLDLFLATEMETIAEFYEALYQDLVRRVSGSFRTDGRGLYRGGVRRIDHLKKVDENDKSRPYRERIVQSLREQNAHLFAMRCLNLSRRAIAELPQELGAWEKLLRRSRDRVLLANARDRSHVRELVVSAMKSVVGGDPLSGFTESYQMYFSSATDTEHWGAFKATLERDFDISFSGVSEPGSATEQLKDLVAAVRQRLARGTNRLQEDPQSGCVGGTPFSGLERFVSEVQRLLEDTPETRNLISLKSLGCASPDVEPALRELWTLYEHEYGTRDNTNLEHLINAQHVKTSVCIVAFSYGEPVGFVIAKQHDFVGFPGLEVTDMFVSKPMRRSGISRRLIRNVIDAAPIGCRFVWLDGEHLDRVTEAFVKSGFQCLGKDESAVEYRPPFFYELYGVTNAKSQLVDWEIAKSTMQRSRMPSTTPNVGGNRERYSPKNSQRTGLALRQHFDS